MNPLGGINLIEERLPLCVPDSPRPFGAPLPPMPSLPAAQHQKAEEGLRARKEKRRVYFGSVSSGSDDAEWVSFSQTTKTTVTISKASGRKKPAADA